MRPTVTHVSSSNQQHPAPRTGAHRAHGRTSSGAAAEERPPPPFRHEPYLDGLFTYCLSVLCDHDTATDVLGDVLAVAERYPGRCPDESDRRAWLYALARWACLQPARRTAAHPAGSAFRPARAGAQGARAHTRPAGPCGGAACHNGPAGLARLVLLTRHTGRTHRGR